MIINSDFKPAWWLINKHSQTVYATLLRRVKAPINRHERITLPDGDFLDLAWCTEGLPAETPLIILLHGLAGSVNSNYIAGFMNKFKQRGWRSVLMHFRGASEEPNRLLRAYHSGDTADFDYIIRLIAEREPLSLKAAIGVSLGGNVLLKWLGECQRQSYLQTAVAISVPFQIRSVADRLGRGFSRLYQSYLLTQLKKLFHRKIKNHKGNLPEGLQALSKINCFWTFDEMITAPLNGFENVHAYYRKTSSRSYLKDIYTPSLIIHALDDPFMTLDALPRADELSPEVTLELTRKGGHVGFIAGNIPFKPIYWLEERIPYYLDNFFTSTQQQQHLKFSSLHNNVRKDIHLL